VIDVLGTRIEDGARTVLGLARVKRPTDPAERLANELRAREIRPRGWHSGCDHAGRAFGSAGSCRRPCVREAGCRMRFIRPALRPGADAPVERLLRPDGSAVLPYARGAVPDAREPGRNTARPLPFGRRTSTLLPASYCPWLTAPSGRRAYQRKNVPHLLHGCDGAARVC
jgi:hypothetical protein